MKPSNETPSANEWGKLRSYLAKKGVKQADINAAVGDKVKGRNRHEIVAQLTAWLKTRPKGER